MKRWMLLLTWLCLLAGVSCSEQEGTTSHKAVVWSPITAYTLGPEAQALRIEFEITNPDPNHRPILRKEGSAPWIHLQDYAGGTYFDLTLDANTGGERSSSLRLTYADSDPLILGITQLQGSGDSEPEPEPTPEGGLYRAGWPELPYEVEDADYYYAHHLTDVTMQGNRARNYTVCFSAEHHCPVWVAAPRHAAYVGSVNRTDAYQPDPQIPTNLQYYSKSTGGGCNKGHMLGSAERTLSTETNRQVFYYSNIAPQQSANFNTGGGGWNTLEDHIDALVCPDTTYVVIGCYFESYTDCRGYTASPKKIEFGGRSDVSCPTMFYYAVLRTKQGNTGKSVRDCSASELQCVAFVRSHNTPKGTEVGEKDLMSIADLEALTGHTLFGNVPNAPKSSYTASEWY